MGQWFWILSMSQHLFPSPTIFPSKNVSDIWPQRRYSLKVKFNYFLTFSGDNLCCDHLGFFGQANILSKASSYLEVKMYQKFCPQLSLKKVFKQVEIYTYHAILEKWPFFLWWPPHTLGLGDQVVVPHIILCNKTWFETKMLTSDEKTWF